LVAAGRRRLPGKTTIAKDDRELAVYDGRNAETFQASQPTEALKETYRAGGA
jgi:hypothetical protein